MKKKILISLSYILVAMLATVATLAAIGYPGYASGTKLEQLESLILERFIGDADQTAMEDAAARHGQIPWRPVELLYPRQRIRRP